MHNVKLYRFYSYNSQNGLTQEWLLYPGSTVLCIGVKPLKIKTKKKDGNQI